MDLRGIVAFGPPKEAALYFERVFPFDLGLPIETFLGDPAVYRQMMEKAGFSPSALDPTLHIPMREDRSLFDDKIVQNLLKVDNSRRIYLELGAITICKGIIISLCTEAGFASFMQSSFVDKAPYLFSSTLDLNFNNLVVAVKRPNFDPDKFLAWFTMAMLERIKTLANKSGFANCPFWDFYTADEFQINNQKKANSFFASIQGLNLVDPRKIGWEKLLEIRKDKNSHSAMRDLRLFFQENYEGKEITFIQDDLLSRIEKYDNAKKNWQLDTVMRSLSVVISPKNLVAMPAASWLPQLTGVSLSLEPMLGAAVAIGNVMLEFGNVYVEAKKSKQHNPIRYLADLPSQV